MILYCNVYMLIVRYWFGIIFVFVGGRVFICVDIIIVYILCGFFSIEIVINIEILVWKYSDINNIKMYNLDIRVCVF